MGPVEVKIGVQNIPRELVVETPSSPDEVEKGLRDALANGGVLTLTDDKGGRVLIPVEHIGYLEIGANESRRVGFGAL